MYRRTHPHAAPVAGWGTLVCMALTLPLGIRVAAGLIGAAIDRATTLPAELPSIVVTIAGQALRTSMRLQQEVAELATRGDELLAPLTGRAQENPPWATFDEDDEDAPAVSAYERQATTDRSTSGAQEPAVTLLDGTPVVDEPVVDNLQPAGPGETVPTGAGFVVGPAVPPEALIGGTPGDVVVTELSSAPVDTTAAVATPADATPVAAARRAARARGRTTITGDHQLTIAELKERTQTMGAPEVQALLAQEEAGPNRAAYLTLLGNRLMTLQHEDR